ncbi:hypothetical protein C7H19_19275 [Aphanothece hegewaldii CCALA 016]|uniref:Uncharacterized protein n=1 Tax=Aphanothece hegewaldii CCALA 016 TaxID=2107694 RepID=A0A2T1LTH0_9CHRO|nr:hypothetical protein [Aphanothece hegewaldii]PSF33867.1 hypothetical protein C7H19_19275 [Aphanothece hegewaldii CCALA 016]
MATKKSNSNQFSVFGTRPDNAICLPDIPYSVRLNCKDGGLFIGGYEAQHRKTNPDQKVDIAIIKASKFFGTLGKTENVLWIQLFYIAAPNVPLEILPKNTVCCSYIKKQSIAHLFNKVQEAMSYGDPGFGIFTLSFNKEIGEKGIYYTVNFDWRERQSEEEHQQLELIKAFMSTTGDQLTDLEGTRALTCVNGWSSEQLQALIAQRQELGGNPNQRSLPAA